MAHDGLVAVNRAGHYAALLSSPLNTGSVDGAGLGEVDDSFECA